MIHVIVQLEGYVWCILLSHLDLVIAIIGVNEA